VLIQRRLDAAAPDAAGPDVAAPDAAGPDVAAPDAAGPDSLDESERSRLACSAVADAERAAAGFARLGDLPRAVEATLLAAVLEATRLGRSQAGRDRALAAEADCRARGADELAEWCRQVQSSLSA
jgi:hypothetical protein